MANDITAPNAPTITNVMLNSDYEATVVFSISVSAEKPCDSLLLFRCDNDGDYIQVAKFVFSSASNSFTDKTLTPNIKARYKMRAENDAGASGYSPESNNVYTHPSAPSGLSAMYNASGTSVTTEWTNNAPYADRYELQSANNVSFTGATTTTVHSTTYTDTNPPTPDAFYRVRAVLSDAKYSPWSNIVKVATLSKPAPPTVVSPSSGAVFKVSGNMTVKWIHNSVDGTAQQAARVMIKRGDAAWETFDVSGSVSEKVISLAGTDAGTSILVKVSTKGAHSSYSDDSEVISTSIQNIPTVVITNPATDESVIERYPLLTSWSTTCQSGSIVYTRWELDGMVVELDDATSYTLDSDVHVLDDNREYELTVTVRSSYGLEASATRKFKVVYEQPAPPSIEMRYDTDAGSADIVISGSAGSIYIATGTEIEGAFYCFKTSRNIWYYFVMPHMESGDKLWLDTENEKLYYVEKDREYHKEHEVPLSEGAAKYTDTGIEIDSTFANYYGTGVILDASVFSFSGTGVQVGSPNIIHFDDMGEASYYVVFRKTDDGEELVDGHVEVGSTFVDYLPPLNVWFTYKVVSISNDGGMSTVYQPAFVRDHGYFFWNYDNGFAKHSKMRCEPEYSHDTSNNSESVLFEGDSVPTCYGGTGGVEDLDVSACAYTLAERNSIMVGLKSYQGMRMIYRTPYGEVYPVRVAGVSCSNTDVPQLWSIKVKQERVI